MCVLTVVVDDAHEVDQVRARLGRAHARHHLLALRTVVEQELCERVVCIGLSRNTHQVNN